VTTKWRLVVDVGGVEGIISDLYAGIDEELYIR
jgi:hypothetical protein